MAGSSPAASPLVVGRYALHGKIASGGMATVYFGRMAGAAGFARTVAIKRLHPHLAEEPEFVSMMIDEGRLVARVQHPNVAQTLDVVAEGGELLIVMEYVAGDSLARLLRMESARQRQVPLPIVSAMMNGVLHGLHAAHEAKSDRGVPLGIVHRDVSPHNVIVGVDGLARVIDFGVAKAAGRIQTTREGVVKGKLAYMAPEQLAGQVTTRIADVYAAGVVLWEMLTGRRLFRADDDAMLLAQVLAGPHDSPSRWVAGLPPALDALVMRALARDPTERFATAREMADAVVRAVPPALAAEVGAWVEEVARQVLDERSAHVAEIERSSVTQRVPAGAHARAAGSPDASPGLTSAASQVSWRVPWLVAGDELPTEVSQPSSISVETPVRRLVRSVRARRVRSWLGLGAAAAVLAGIAAVLAWPTGSQQSVSSSPSATAVVSAAPGATGPASVLPPATAVASVALPPPPFASSSSESLPAAAQTAPRRPARTSVPPPAAPARPAKPAPRAAGSVVYDTPD